MPRRALHSSPRTRRRARRRMLKIAMPRTRARYRAMSAQRDMQRYVHRQASLREALQAPDSATRDRHAQPRESANESWRARCLMMLEHRLMPRRRVNCRHAGTRPKPMTPRRLLGRHGTPFAHRQHLTVCYFSSARLPPSSAGPAENVVFRRSNHVVRGQKKVKERAEVFQQ